MEKENKIYTYGAKVVKEEGGYTIHLLDFDQYTCTDFKETVDYMAKDLLGLLVASCIDDGIEIPEQKIYDESNLGEDEYITYVSISSAEIDRIRATYNVTDEEREYLESELGEKEQEEKEAKYDIIKAVYNKDYKSVYKNKDKILAALDC